MYAVINAEELRLNKKARVYYGSLQELDPKREVKSVVLADGTVDKVKVWIDFVIQATDDQAVNNKNILRVVQERYPGAVLKTETDWQSRKWEQRVEIPDGK